MRKTPWILAALMFGCAQSEGRGEPVELASVEPAPAVDGGTPTVAADLPADGGTDPAAAAADAGPLAAADAGPPAPAGPCNPSIDASAGIAISDTGACPGIMPAPPSCAADLILCSGVGASLGGGIRGTFAASAAGDGHGALALGCASSDVGPSQFVGLYLPTPSGFVSKSFFGYEAWATGTGFVTNSVYAGPPSYDFRAHDGNVLASVPVRGRIFVGTGSIVVVSFAAQGSDTVVTARGYGKDGAPLADAQPVATLTGVSAGSVMLGGAAGVGGETLAIWQVYGEAAASARWLRADGTPATDTFALGGWMDHAPEAAALAGGAIALPTGSPSDGGAKWRGLVAAGATVEQPAPQWLASRGFFQLLRGGTAMAFGKEVLTSDGTLCGTLDLGAPLLGVGADGTAVTARDQKTFRIYPQLFR